jgi:hypothetical protein
MVKKTHLAEALHQAASRPGEAVPARGSLGESVTPPSGRIGIVPPSRVGLKTVAGHFDPAVSRQLRSLALERDSSLQELLREAINDLFAKYRKAPLA